VCVCVCVCRFITILLRLIHWIWLKIVFPYFFPSNKTDDLGFFANIPSETLFPTQFLKKKLPIRDVGDAGGVSPPPPTEKRGGAWSSECTWAERGLCRCLDLYSRHVFGDDTSERVLACVCKCVCVCVYVYMCVCVLTCLSPVVWRCVWCRRSPAWPDEHVRRFRLFINKPFCI